MKKFPILDSILEESINYEDQYPFSTPREAYEAGMTRILSFLSEYDDEAIITFIRAAREELITRINIDSAE